MTAPLELTDQQKRAAVRIAAILQDPEQVSAMLTAAMRYEWLTQHADETASLVSDAYACWDPDRDRWSDELNGAVDAAMAVELRKPEHR